jgi:hypothetical protein
MATAKRRAIDRMRQHQLHARKQTTIDHDDDWQPALLAADPETAADDVIGDDVLRLVFTACHPVLSSDAQVALTLRLLGGLTTEEIARACLVPEPTIAQRIVRAKRTLSEANVPFETPGREELPQRLAAVLGVVYLIFNEGYAATSGADWMRPALCDEALRLGRILVALRPLESEVHGLLALMELQASRIGARTKPDGTPILLLEQDRTRWDHLYIQRGLASLRHAERLGGAEGPYALQAALAACHARAPTCAGHRLAAHRRFVRRARLAHGLARGRAQSRGRRRDGLRAAGGAGRGRCDRRCARTARLPPVAQRARRSAAEARPRRRSACRVRTRRGPGAQRTRGRIAASSRGLDDALTPRPSPTRDHRAMPIDRRDPAGRTQSRGRCHLYVLPVVVEDLLKLGFSRDPLARLQQLHPRWYEQFDLDRAFTVETESVPDARRLELRFRRQLERTTRRAR